MAHNIILKEVYEISENDIEFALPDCYFVLERGSTEVQIYKIAIDDKGLCKNHSSCHKIKPTLDLWVGYMDLYIG